ncbi:NUDIX hydrolase [Klugiella xanthotipulae]|uniref:ADP-ribose pyrophosphatase n=1 Tax=Klugiella xanthotipulae TaxID=244735 RepID=A0A543I3V8_9MICO|nr:NUDIX hydrolase [Klugiella xanthotipulae]TQM65283.1 ADP-ribose pyrophosphatase [Klugiella xanthotipulae]
MAAERPALAGSELYDVATPEIEVESSEIVFTGRVWDVRRDTFAYGDGTLKREYTDHTGAVAVLALDDAERMLLIQQYRHPIAARDWEIPAGLMDVAGESPLAGAQRELAEEADLVATEWAVLSDFVMTPGGSTEAMRIYLARGLSDADEVFARTGEEADIRRAWVPLDEVVTAVLERRVQNPAVVVGALTAQAARSRGWSTLAPADALWERREWVRGTRS